MKLTDQQIKDIKNQQSQENKLKELLPELEQYNEAIPVLDHGFIRVIDYMGDDSNSSSCESFLWKRNKKSIGQILV